MTNKLKLDTLVRDLTKVNLQPKSYVRRRIAKYSIELLAELLGKSEVLDTAKEVRHLIKTIMLNDFYDK